MQTRRRFIKTVSTSGIALLGAQAVESKQSSVNEVRRAPFSIGLCEGWEFRLDPDAAADPSSASAHAASGVADRWQQVHVPHTWQSLGKSPKYVGVAWYRLRFDAPASWASQHVRIEFEAVNHTAHVFLNDKPIGEHVGKGYTAFTVDLSSHLDLTGRNTLMVRVDNRPGDRMLPRNKSYDWTDDGGIIRPVTLLVTPPTLIDRLEIDAVPDLTSGSAEVRVRAIVRNAGLRADKIKIHATIRRERNSDEVLQLGPTEAVPKPDSEQIIELGPATLKNADLWHFDAPHLYKAVVELDGPTGAHQMTEHFGVRKFEVRGQAFYLNGEKVSLIGVERMAGSHPELGFAETPEWIDTNHRDIKLLNCVFTRVHWAQDRRVLDFCDRNGILMQEEVPA